MKAIVQTALGVAFVYIWVVVMFALASIGGQS
jgi:hypothetical protein